MIGIQGILLGYLFKLILITALFMSADSYSKNQIAPIKLGMSTALSGPAKKIGSQLHQGSKIYFDKINQGGGINGQLINLLVADDGYEPKKAVVNTRKFIYSDQVFALFGSMGTPTAHAIKPLLEQHNTLYLMPYTGARFLHYQPSVNVFNLRISYLDEAKEQVKYLVEEQQSTNIGFLIQADEFGYAVETDLIKSLESYGIKPVKVARFKRNSDDIKSALQQLSKSNIDAISLVGTYQPLAEFINQAHQENFIVNYTSVSFSSSDELFKRVNNPVNLMVTEVLPDPSTCKNDWCDTFMKDMHNAGLDKPNRLLFEGYLNAAAFTAAANLCPPPLSEKCLKKQLASLSSIDKQLFALFNNKNQRQQPNYRSYKVD